MAKYTVELHDLLTNEETNNLIKKALSSYPMYEPIHKELYGYIPTREQLNKKILDHYRFYQIGQETPGRFLYYLEATMNEIMPKYNQLYKSVDIMNGLEDIFGNLDVEESFTQETTGNSSSQSSGNTKDSSSSKTEGSNTNDVTSQNTTNTDMSTSGRNVKSTTPQSQLQIKTIDQITAASEIGWNEDSSKSNSTSNDKSNTKGTNESSSTGSSEQESNSNASSESKGKVTHTLKRKGNQGVNTYAHDMLEFRQLFLNIEQQIINDPELVKCFMLIW